MRAPDALDVGGERDERRGVENELWREGWDTVLTTQHQDGTEESLVTGGALGADAAGTHAHEVLLEVSRGDDVPEAGHGLPRRGRQTASISCD